MNHTRPARGAARLDDLTFDPAELSADLARIEAASPWKTLNYGDRWGKIELWKDEQRHALWDQCPAFQQVVAAFDTDVLDVSLARLGPGGWIKEHRDISGGVPMGVARFHVPIVTHPDVEFYVSRKRLFLAPGEVWNLDTTYLHRLRNNSDVWRVHLIVDVKLNDKVRAMLPATTLRDALHRVHFWLICVAKGCSLAFQPRALWSRVVNVFRLRVLRRSSL